MHRKSTEAIKAALNHCRALDKITCIDIIENKEGDGFWKMNIQVKEGFEHLFKKIEPICINLGWLNGEGLWANTEGRWLFLS